MTVRQLGMHQACCQKIIPRQYGYLIIKDSIHRELPTAFGTFVHYVVMHQTGIMKKFQRYRRMKSGRRHDAIKACYQQDENRTHHLSTALAYMSYYAIKQCIRTGKRTIIKFFESLKFAFNRCSDNRDAVHSCTI